MAMYRAVRPYQAEQEHILSLSSGEALFVLERNNDTWWLASNDQGKVGYVLRTYLREEKEDSNDVALLSVDNAIEEIIASAGPNGPSKQQQALLKKLLKHKDTLAAGAKKLRQSSTKRRAPPPPPPRCDAAHTAEPSTHKETTAPAVPQRTNSLSSSPRLGEDRSHCGDFKVVDTQSPSEPTSSVGRESETEHRPVKHEVPDYLGVELVKILQTKLNISQTKSRAAVSALVQSMKNHIPSLQAAFNDVLCSLPEETKDEESDKLGLALENLREIKDDAQQRNWAIEDDEEKIMAILNEILTELTTIDKNASIKAIRYDHNLPIQTLVDYHQMETRVGLRLAVLQIFGAICSMSKSFVSAVLATVLPLELAMDVTTRTQETQRVCYSALVMSMLFSTAEPMPVGHYERLNKAFVEFLIKYIEGEVDGIDQDEQVVEMFINVILSFNLHMQIPSDNTVMQVVSERGTCTNLSEKIMVLLNRGDDPVVLEEHWTTDDAGRPPPSVLKFLQDVFSQRSTSSFLYTNDMNVLIDITTRNLTDLPSGSKLRTDYLDLLLNLLTNTNYSETRHRATDIGQSLNRIVGEEQPETDSERQTLDFDKRIIDNIMTSFGHFFS